MLYSQYFINKQINLGRQILTLMFLIALAVSTFSQKKTKAVLVDEFGKVNCDDFLARTDNFFMQLHANPLARGYFVVSGRNDLLRGKLFWEKQFERIASMRMRDRSRLAVIRGPETGNFNIQFWIIPQEADVPDFKTSIWNFSLPTGTKPFVISSDLGEMCEDPVNPPLINEFLKSNPGMRVHVVIYANRSETRRKGLMDTKTALQRIPAGRIRYFFKKFPGYSVPLAEYWLVPENEN